MEDIVPPDVYPFNPVILEGVDQGPYVSGGISLCVTTLYRIHICGLSTVGTAGESTQSVESVKGAVVLLLLLAN